MALAQWTNAMEWLAAAAQDPRACKRAWQHGTSGTHLLAAGRFWDVLIVPACLGLRAADLLDGIPRLDPGPALLDERRQHVGFFLPPDPATTWIGQGTRYVTSGGWIATPAPHCRWGRLRWLCPPDASRTLNAPEAMERVLCRALDEMVRSHGIRHHAHELPRRIATTPLTAVSAPDSPSPMQGPCAVTNVPEQHI